MKNKFKYVVLGAGTGGITAAAQIKRKLGSTDICIIDKSEHHYYQPYWTLVGAGIGNKEQTRKPVAELIPKGATWIKESVKKVEPQNNKLITDGGREIEYETLIVSTGLKLDFDKIKGVPESLGKNGVHTVYEYDQCEKTYEALRQLKSGKALFVMPPVPIKCAGAPQKIMYLADDLLRENGVREQVEVHFYKAGEGIFGIPAFAKSLTEICKRQNIHTHFNHELVEVDVNQKKAIFKKTISTSPLSTEMAEVPFDFIHIVPPMSAHSYVVESGIAWADGPHKGWLKVDPFTLQHLDYKNIFGVGDVTGIPNAKTGAAVRKQVPVVIENIKAYEAGQSLGAKYDGYSSCPLVTSKGTAILAEFGYDGKLLPSFPLDPTKERWSMWILKRYLLPILYWKGMLKGRA